MKSRLGLFLGILSLVTAMVSAAQAESESLVCAVIPDTEIRSILAEANSITAREGVRYSAAIERVAAARAERYTAESQDRFTLTYETDGSLKVLLPASVSRVSAELGGTIELSQGEGTADTHQYYGEKAGFQFSISILRNGDVSRRIPTWTLKHRNLESYAQIALACVAADAALTPVPEAPAPVPRRRPDVQRFIDLRKSVEI